MPTRTLRNLRTMSLSLAAALLVASVPAHAGTIAIGYTLTGVTTINGVSPTTVSLSGTNTGSFTEADLAVNATWNPVAFTYASQASIASGALAGVFTLTLANGEILSGTVNEDLSAIFQSPTRTGPYTQTLTFTAGTGEFAGVSGSASGTGYAGPSGGTVSGTGSLTAPAFLTPEPPPLALMMGGLGLLTVAYRRRHKTDTRSSETWD